MIDRTESGLYGNTMSGGASPVGTIFKLVPTQYGTSKVLSSGGPADVAVRRMLGAHGCESVMRDFCGGEIIVIETTPADVQGFKPTNLASEPKLPQ